MPAKKKPVLQLKDFLEKLVLVAWHDAAKEDLRGYVPKDRENARFGCLVITPGILVVENADWIVLAEDSIDESTSYNGSMEIPRGWVKSIRALNIGKEIKF